MTGTPKLPLRDLPPGPLVVAVSGGMDSMALLHALCFGPDVRTDLVVAHLDHAMRPEGAGDAAWLRGVCRAWDVPLVLERLTKPPASEAEARDARYRFLEGVRTEQGGSAVLTAHTADDQAETVLFRVLRGTGVRGLAGMVRPRAGLSRPLLGTWKREVEAYAAACRVPHREDSTNQDLRYARNAIRHRLLPEAEALVATGSRASLVRLGENAARVETEMAAMEEALLEDCLRRSVRGRVELDAARLSRLSPPARRRLLRRAARGLGVTLSRQASDAATEAIEALHPGKGLDLSGGIRLERGVEEWILVSPAAPGPSAGSDNPEPSASRLRIPGVEPGTAQLELGPLTYRLAWGFEPSGGLGELAVRPPVRLPLTFRGWSPGDRIHLGSGSRSVARLLGEAGIPRMDRPFTPVALDGRDHVVWVPGVVAAPGLAGSAGDSHRDADLFVHCVPLTRG